MSKSKEVFEKEDLEVDKVGPSDPKKKEGESQSHWGKREEEFMARAEKGREIDLREVLVGQKLKIITQNRTYWIEKREDGYYIQGHPEYCPEPTKVRISGSVFGGSSMLVMNKIVEEMNLEFILPDGRSVRTSLISEISEEGLLEKVQ